jgi:hypothetical protein
MDVLLSIRDVISSAPFTSLDPGLGLFAHLALSQTCRRLRGIYMLSTPESENMFWKRACVMAGYGRPMRREYPQALPGFTPPDIPPPEVLSWKQIALLVTAHKRVCEIRSCRNASCWPGEYRVHSDPEFFFWACLARHAGYSQSSMRITALSVSPPTSINSLPFRHLCHVTRTLANQNVSATEPLFGKRSIHELTDDDSHHQSGTLAFHPLFYYLHFSAGAELDPSAVLHSLLPTHPDCRRKLYAPLCGHASAACAFATSPPVRSITLMRPDSDCAIASVRNPDGCTILDVNRLLGDLCVSKPIT